MNVTTPGTYKLDSTWVRPTEGTPITIQDGRVRHGMDGTRIYRAWTAMRARCNPRYKDIHRYRHYAGKGITVCDRWEQFENFYVDMGPQPTPDCYMDRIDPNGNYEPGNCRWVSRQESNANRSRPLTNHGPNVYNSKLSELDVMYVMCCAARGVNHEDVALRVGIGTQGVSKIINGRTYKSIDRSGIILPRKTGRNNIREASIRWHK